MKHASVLLTAFAVFLLVLVVGCGNGPTVASYPTGPSDTTFQGLRLELDVEPEVVAAGDTVDVIVRVTNATDSVITLATPTTCLFRPDVFLWRGGTLVEFGPAYFCGGAYTEWTIASDSTVERRREIHTGDVDLQRPFPAEEYVVAAGFEVHVPFELPTLRPVRGPLMDLESSQHLESIDQRLGLMEDRMDFTESLVSERREEGSITSGNGDPDVA